MKYPGGVKVKDNNYIEYGNRGMSLEEDINKANEYYRLINRAIIYKKPTPIQATKVVYNKGKGKLIAEGYFKTPSTTDYNGLYRGKYIDFEAKETKHKNYFPLTSIHTHQIEHIKKIIEHGGITFLIIRFLSLGKTFLVKGEDFITYLTNKPKSIPISFFNEYAKEIEESYNPRLKYLEIIDKLYFGGKDHETN